MRQYDACFDGLVECEALGGLQFAEFVVHWLVHDFADEALVSGPLRKPSLGFDLEISRIAFSLIIFMSIHASFFIVLLDLPLYFIRGSVFSFYSTT